MRKLRRYLKHIAALALFVLIGAGLAIQPGCVHSLAASSDDETVISYTDEETFAFKSKAASKEFKEQADSLPSAFDLRHVGGTIGPVENGKTSIK